MARVNDCIRIWEYMKAHGSITGIQATDELRIMDYRKRISELRHAGKNIGDRWETTTNSHGKTSRYKVYFIVEPTDAAGSRICQ